MKRRAFMRAMAHVPAAAIVPVLVRDFGLPTEPKLLAPMLWKTREQMTTIYGGEGLEDVIYNISPQETPFLRLAQYHSDFGPVVAVEHHWIEDELVSTPITEEEMYKL